METNFRISKGTLWTSYVLQGLASIMFLMGAAQNLMQTETAVTGAVEMGYPEGVIFYFGIILVVSTVLYIIPKTTILGAILLTGWLGGAVATHIIHRDAVTFTFLPVIFGFLVWISLWLRNEKVRAILPLS